MADEKNTGYDKERAEKLILKLIERFPGIRPSELEVKLVKNEDRSGGPMSRPMLYRALDSLQEQKLIERVKEKGKKTIRCYLFGKRPIVIENQNPSQFDEFVVNQCEKLLDYMVENKLQMISDSDYFNGLHNNMPELNEIKDRLFSTYQIVQLWEGMRKRKVTKTWSKEINDLYFDLGPDFKNFTGVLYGVPAIEPSCREWFYYFINALDEISRYYESSPYWRRSRKK